jgi:hypothetical protein
VVGSTPCNLKFYYNEAKNHREYRFLHIATNNCGGSSKRGSESNVWRQRGSILENTTTDVHHYLRVLQIGRRGVDWEELQPDGKKGWGWGGSTHLRGAVEVGSLLCAARWIQAADSGRRRLRLCLARAVDFAREWRLGLRVSLCVGNGGFDFARCAGMNAARGSDRRGRKGGLTRWMGETSGRCGGEIFSSDRR